MQPGIAIRSRIFPKTHLFDLEQFYLVLKICLIVTLSMIPKLISMIQKTHFCICFVIFVLRNMFALSDR